MRPIAVGKENDLTMNSRQKENEGRLANLKWLPLLVILKWLTLLADLKWLTLLVFVK
jgi:hypothetical protein